MKSFWNWFWANNESGLDGCGNTVGKMLCVVMFVLAVTGVGFSMRGIVLAEWEQEYQRRMCREGFGRYLVGKDGSPEFTVEKRQ